MHASAVNSSTRRLLCSTWVLLCLFGLTLATSTSNEVFGTEASDGGKAVQRGTSPVWVEYDDESVTVPRNQLERNDYSDRHESIYQNGGTSWWQRFLTNLWGPGSGIGNGGLSDFFSWIASIWRVLFLTLLAILVSTLVYFLLRSETFRLFIARRGQSVEEDVEQQRAKVSDLPFEIEQPLLGLRAQAERLWNLGDYSKAIVYLYSYLLVELDQANCIRLERGKTNGIYIRELTPWKSLTDYMKPSVRLFELAYFGRREIDRASFEALWSRIATFEETLSKIRAGKLSEDSSVAIYADSLPATSLLGQVDVGGARS